MRASRAVRVSLSAALLLTLVAGVLPAAGAGPSLPLPRVMAAVGDSITQAASSAGTLGADAPQNSWATGTSASVNSHYLRLVAAGASSLARHNLSVSGAKMADLPTQTANAAAVQPDYLTVLIGGNDVCTSTAAGMTDPGQFEADFVRALSNVDHERTHVYVVSIPRVMGLWELFRNNFWARFIWSVGGVCQSLLANPTSTNQADVDRRAQVDARNRAFNEILARVCAATLNCHHDGGAAFNTTFTTSDVSGDYFHPSIAGQQKLAAVSWTAGYAWTPPSAPPNTPPRASFTSSCQVLTCSFNASASADSDGTIASFAWAFGDGASGSGVTASRTYAAGGTYAVTLTVTDDDGATATAAGSVTVTAPPAPAIELTVRAYKVKGSQRADLSWSGAATTSVVVFRNGAAIATTPNDGFHTDTINAKGGGTYRYRVCETGGGACSPEVSVSY